MKARRLLADKDFLKACAPATAWQSCCLWFSICEEQGATCKVKALRFSKHTGRSIVACRLLSMLVGLHRVRTAQNGRAWRVGLGASSLSSQGPSAAPEEDADDVQKQDRERLGSAGCFYSYVDTFRASSARCKKESSDRVSDATRRSEMQKKKGGVK